MKSLVFWKVYPCEQGGCHVQEHDEKIRGYAAGRMINGFIFGLDDQGAAAEPLDDFLRHFQSFDFSFQTKINIFKLFMKGFFVSKGLDRMDGGRGGPFGGEWFQDL